MTTALTAGARHRCASLRPAARRGKPVIGAPGGAGRHEYAMWDAAYVLGSLSVTERREFEAHLGKCESCWQALTELGGVAALLALLDRDEVAGIDELASIANSGEAPESFSGRGM
ncbi:hypothetical protein AWC32_11480 [Mycobacterium xenopi]|nr:hypothetical protein AWC32_11480 [Mycobacterium xenopi]